VLLGRAAASIPFSRLMLSRLPNIDLGRVAPPFTTIVEADDKTVGFRNRLLSSFKSSSMLSVEGGVLISSEDASTGRIESMPAMLIDVAEDIWVELQLLKGVSISLKWGAKVSGRPYMSAKEAPLATEEAFAT
jgi:hypothetical protein